jgi:hypothetical protein
MAIEINDDGRKDLNRRSIWRLCGWGGGAAIALTAVVIATYSGTGSKRLQFALANATERGQTTAGAPTPARAVDNSGEIKQLAETVHALTADRDLLKSRIVSLEHTLDDVTGSIRSEASATAVAQSAKGASADTAKDAVKDRVAAAQPVISAPVTAVPTMQMATPAPAAPTLEQVPLPPTRVASVPVAEPQLPAKSEFGIDLGGGATVEAVRSQWSLVKANYGPLLLGLHPVATLRERRPGAPEYRLVVGPLPSINAAAKLCARFAAHPGCRPTKFDGQRIAQQ